MKHSLILGICLLIPGLGQAAETFALADGDRVVLLGNTLIEREQRYGYWETLLTSRFPDKNVVFRNLGWSGDTVFGEARAGFGTQLDGFKHLKEHVLSLKPTIILVGYGVNESFQGQPGLPRFLAGLQVLLDTLGQTKARIVLLSPLRHEDLGRPLPDPAEANKNLRLYADALRTVAEKRHCPFVDLYDLLGDGSKQYHPVRLTDNGIHLTAYGYWRSAAALAQGLGLPAQRWRVELLATGKNPMLQGTKLSEIQTMPLRFRITDDTLPTPPIPQTSSAMRLTDQERVLSVRGLPEGKYALRIDGKSVQSGTAAEWAAGITLERGPEFEQVERLRDKIIEKNRQYFHRWRPQNETYLFGFRKHEQGQNAREIPQFDPLIAQLETDIAKLRTPGTHTYELVAEIGGEK